MSTSFNGALCDIYIGTGAGKMLLNDIQNAEKSIKIVSPYLSPELIKCLIDLHHKGIAIELITNDEIKDFIDAPKNIYELIKQHKTKDLESELIRNKWIKYSNYLLITIIVSILSFFLLIFFYRELNILNGIFIIFLLLVLWKLLKNKIKNKRIYSYMYSQLFPFKVYVSKIKNKNFGGIFLHSKIYIIDEKILYLGSLNFTYSGTTTNYESRIRITDINVIKKTMYEFRDLFTNHNAPELNIQRWGSETYKNTEQIN